MFHATLAELLLAQARAVREEYGVRQLGLTGGVFQNRVLCERVLCCAQREGFSVFHAGKATVQRRRSQFRADHRGKRA